MVEHTNIRWQFGIPLWSNTLQSRNT